eukprot:TRINITY_DN2706_c0_g1_i1.p1 TRINITY_DN2706_c0_g1~~TRINITY_DN2706_c0_g1_i1.p1  ORF type:complete len:646 (+),score=56.62 TRINITY_DN2706_c0_g1_i1:76-2013(+)
MGCGSSSGASNVETVANKESSMKYVDNSKGGVDGSPSTSPRLGNNTLPSPNAIKKKKKKDAGKSSPRKDHPKMFDKVETMQDLAVNSALSTTMYTLPKTRLMIKTDPKELGYEDFKLISKGMVTVERGPPKDGTQGLAVSVVSDFIPRFGLNLTEQEKSSILNTYENHTLELSDTTSADIIKKRLKKPRFKSVTMRPIGGYLKSIASVAISSDDRLVTVAMSRGKNIPTGDGPLLVNNIGGPGAGASRSSNVGAVGLGQIPGRASSAGSVTMKVKADAIARIVRCVDLRTGMTIGMLKQKGFDPEATADMLFSVDDQHLISCSSEGSVFLWHMGKMKIHKTFEVGAEFNPTGRLFQVRCSNDGRYVATCGEDIDDDGITCGQVAVWLSDGPKQVQAFMGHKHPVITLTFHPDNKTICSGDKGGHLLIWDAESGEIHKRISSHMITMRTVHYMSATRLLSADERFTRVWEVDHEQHVYTPVWTKHLDSEAVMWSVAKAEAEKEAAEDAESAEDGSQNPEETSDANKSVTPSPKTSAYSGFGCRKLSSHEDEDRDPTDFTLMKPPSSQSRTRQRMLVPMPCGVLLSCVSLREVHLLCPETGEVLSTINTKAPISCAAGGRSTCVLGDIWGNVSALDIEMSNSLPNMY